MLKGFMQSKKDQMLDISLNFSQFKKGMIKA